ncbi:MAG: DUF116 domain-containing protein [Candidatus ainarchaeum sp.]|nr:DUF116 domain-containing protein [Candidatus ainarchaeum sp.]
MNTYEKIRVAIGKVVDTGAHFNAAKATETIAKKLGLSESMIQYTHIELRNFVYEPELKKIPFNERVLFLPHCARNSKKCKATSNGEGFECKHCGACDIDKAKKFADKLGYKKVFIVPGGSMIKKLLLKYNPKAAIGVCCFDEALLSFEMLKKTNIIPQVALLLRAGCKDTMINIPLLEEKLSLIDENLIEVK